MLKIDQSDEEDFIKKVEKNQARNVYNRDSVVLEINDNTLIGKRIRKITCNGVDYYAS